MTVTVAFNIDPNRYSEFCGLLGQFTETLSDDSIIVHSNAYTIVEVSDSEEEEEGN